MVIFKVMWRGKIKNYKEEKFKQLRLRQFVVNNKTAQIHAYVCTSNVFLTFVFRRGAFRISPRTPAKPATKVCGFPYILQANYGTGP
jgi:hypothetical protein